MPAVEVLAVTARTASLLCAPDGTNYRFAQQLKWSLTGPDGSLCQSGDATTAGVFLEGLSPQATYRFSCDLGAVNVTTLPCTGLIDATDFGADPDTTDNREAFAAAIAAVPRGGTLRLTAGIYRTGPLFLKPDMTFLLEENATLAAIEDRTDWPILPAYDEANRVIGTWEGLPEPCHAALLTAIGCDRLSITGRGVIDGGGDRGDWWLWPKETRNGARRPRTVHLLHGQNVTLTGVTVCNSPSWTLHPYRCSGLHVSNVIIQNPADSPNTDGLNPESCDNTEIVVTLFSVGDDCIAIKAGKRGDDGGTAHLAPTRDIRIRHCRMERGHGAVVLGSEMSGDIHNVSISCCEFDATDRGIRIKTRRGRGGVVSGVTVTDVTMHRVATPLAINAFYFCDHDGKSDRVQCRLPAPRDDTTPAIRNIRMRNVVAHDVTLAAAALLGLPEAPIEEVTLEAFRVSFCGQATPAVPLMAFGVPAVRHATVFSEFADIGGFVEVLCRTEEDVPC